MNEIALITKAVQIGLDEMSKQSKGQKKLNFIGNSK